MNTIRRILKILTLDTIAGEKRSCRSIGEKRIEFQLPYTYYTFTIFLCCPGKRGERFYLFFVAHPYQTMTKRATALHVRNLISVGIAFITLAPILVKASLNTVVGHNLDSTLIRRNTRCVQYCIRRRGVTITRTRYYRNLTEANETIYILPIAACRISI